ncbi:hypothetical protein [Sporosarcina sp. ITBMC105]
MKRILVMVLGLVLLLSIVTQVPAAAAEVENQTKGALSTLFTEIMD